MKTSTQHSPIQLLTAGEVAATIRATEPVTLTNLHSMIHHPRSLARSTGTWRPPSTSIRLIDGSGTRSMLIATITRHRVGSRARARVVGYSGCAEPAYLISLRITDPSGIPVAQAAAEGWVRAIVSEAHAGTVHELSGTPHDHAATYAWLVDASFTPVASPPSLFAAETTAA